jgi:hypothetical protein
LRVLPRLPRWLPALAGLVFCWLLSGCGHPESGSLDLSKTRLGLEGEVMPAGKAALPPAAKRR